MDIISRGNIRTQSIKNLYQQYGHEVDVLRLDTVHPVISGNKWFKLQFYISQALTEEKKGILTFGGAWSNHIVATAEACKLAGLAAVGLIRGEKPLEFSPTLQQAEEAGMQLIFISRENYRMKKIPEGYGDYLVVPEGGYGVPGANGAATILSFLKRHYTQVIVASGTGVTLAGLCKAAPLSTRVTGISVLKNNFSLQEDINQLLPEEKKNSFNLLHDFHQGGYAKYNDTLIRFMNEWYQKTSIPTDFVYTGKVFLATDLLIHSGYFAKHDSILIIHTGGLQGNRSLSKGTLIF